MAVTPRTLCLALALLCAVVATFYVATPPRFNLIAAAIAFLALAFLVPG